MRRHLMLVPTLLIVAGLSIAMVGRQPMDPRFTSVFGIHCDDVLLPSGGNEYFSLDPGTFLRLEGEDDGEPVAVEISVSTRIHPISFHAEGGFMIVRTRVVVEREWVKGELSEVSFNYFASCPNSGNIYYFGEHVSHYKNGIVVDHDGSWVAGENGAEPGLLLPGFFLLGSRYQHEFAPEVSMDRAENVASGLTIETPAGVFEDCVMVLETTPLEPDEEVLKVYAPGVGLISDGQLELVEYHQLLTAPVR